MRIPRPTRKKARIEIIPMIDTMFFLLVFFMVATLSMKARLAERAAFCASKPAFIVASTPLAYAVNSLRPATVVSAPKDSQCRSRCSNWWQRASHR